MTKKKPVNHRNEDVGKQKRIRVIRGYIRFCFLISVYSCSFVVKRFQMLEQPRGELVIQTIAMPKDTNPNGDIFGGWLTSQMDLGSAILAAKTAQARVVTVAMEGMSFLQPVRVGDTVRCYARVDRIGRTSMTIPVEVWVTRFMTGEDHRVTHGVFTLVAVDETGKPIPVKRNQPRMDTN